MVVVLQTPVWAEIYVIETDHNGLLLITLPTPSRYIEAHDWACLACEYFRKSAGQAASHLQNPIRYYMCACAYVSPSEKDVA